ncbi:MAG: hypothetical protein NTV06_09565, partial [candidate division Zixibacteria bacterium]|nr:hypothetical protein [candidate division Zixibacteria bacterium]
MKSKMLLLVLLLSLLSFGQVFGASYGTLTFRAAISGPGAFDDAGTMKIIPDSLCSISIYATNTGGDTRRITWSMPIVFGGTGGMDTVEWVSPPTIANVARATFKSFWDVFKTQYTESWNGDLTNDNFIDTTINFCVDSTVIPPDTTCDTIINTVIGDMYNYTGVGNARGFGCIWDVDGDSCLTPIDGAEYQIYLFCLKVRSTALAGKLWITQGDAADDVYDWIFDELCPTPSPVFD